jgi:UPF0755 protein
MHKILFNTLFIIFLVFISSFISIYYFLIMPPKDFPIEKIISIQSKNNLREISLKLKQEKIIKSRVAFETFVIIYGGERKIIPADYLFKNKISVTQIAKRIVNKDDALNPIKFIIPEGFNNLEIAELFSLKLKNFNKEKFLNKVHDKQGYLFPDTYFFYLTDDEEIVLESINKNFKRKIMSLEKEIQDFGMTEKEIIIMASIIEKESKGEGDREFISGILWKRFKQKMLLQVDAAPETYKILNLPEKPIANPGLASIKAAIYPKESLYYYYLHDKNKNIYYAKTFKEHQKNIDKYLRNLIK